MMKLSQTRIRSIFYIIKLLDVQQILIIITCKMKTRNRMLPNWATNHQTPCTWPTLAIERAYMWIRVYIYTRIVRENQFNLVKVWRRHREWKLVQLAAKSTSLQEIYFRARESIDADDEDDEDEDEEGRFSASFCSCDTCMNISMGETRADAAR